MPNPIITFSVVRPDDAPAKLIASLDERDCDESDIRLKFARQAMIYTQSIVAQAPFAFSNNPGDLTEASLTFTNSDVTGDGEEYFEYDDPDDELDSGSFYNNDDLDDQGPDNQIGFYLKVDGITRVADRPLGWACAPAVLAAQEVSKLIRVAIERSAGYEQGFSSEKGNYPDSDEAPDMSM